MPPVAGVDGCRAGWIVVHDRRRIQPGPVFITDIGFEDMELATVQSHDRREHIGSQRTVMVVEIASAARPGKTDTVGPVSRRPVRPLHGSLRRLIHGLPLDLRHRHVLGDVEQAAQDRPTGALLDHVAKFKLENSYA